MVDLPDTMKKNSKIIQNLAKFHPNSSKIKWAGLYEGRVKKSEAADALPFFSVKVF